MNEIIVQPTGTSEISTMRSPKLVLEEAKIASKALKEILMGKDKPVMFKGEQYLEFEDWATIAKFYGLACRTLEPEEVVINDVVGAEARAEIIDIKSGQIVGGASAWCLRDEENWRNKPWFQLGSMAQTRAGSKALRNLLSWVVVLAGFRTTPAEEIQGEMTNDAIEPAVRHQPVGPQSRVAGNLVNDILDKLVALHQGNQEEVEEHLKFITKYKNKDGAETWLKVSDLENVAKRKPEWIERIHTRVLAAFDKSK